MKVFCENVFLENLVQFTEKHRHWRPSFTKHVTEKERDRRCFSLHFGHIGTFSEHLFYGTFVNGSE